MTRTAEIPSVFFWDHSDRDLPTPKVLRLGTRDRLIIDLDDPAMPDLMSDAVFYADSESTDAPDSIKNAAKWLLKVLRKVEAA